MVVVVVVVVEEDGISLVNLFGGKNHTRQTAHGPIEG